MRQKIIKSIDYCDFNQLADFKWQGKNSVSIGNATPWVPIPIEPLKSGASLSVSNKLQAGNTIYTAKVKFNTCADLGEMRRKVYRVMLVDGIKLLIGTDERPFCETVITQNAPKKITDNQLNEVEITYSSTSFMPCII